MEKLKKERTVKYMREKITVSEEVKAKSKEFARIRRNILKLLDGEHKSIPQIAEEACLSLDVITYNLMSLRKYGYITETGEITDDDYYLYKSLKKK